MDMFFVPTPVQLFSALKQILWAIWVSKMELKELKCPVELRRDKSSKQSWNTFIIFSLEIN